MANTTWLLAPGSSDYGIAGNWSLGLPSASDTAFQAGASATYHASSHHLTVHSGGVTDTLTLLGPLSTHFEAISDGHGGTDLLLHA